MVLAPPNFLAHHLSGPVAILGEGVSGHGVRALLGALGREGVAYDARGLEFTAAAASRHRLAVYSPGFPPGHPWIARAREAGCLCLGELDFASIFWRGRVVAVTGTNGKTTLTEFLTHALQGLGRGARVAGNVGHAFSRLAAAAGGGDEDATAVCEVSSFQAETMEYFQADATLWTNFAEDHLERHRTMDAYFAAKAVLAARSDRLFAGSSVRAYAAASSGRWRAHPSPERWARVPDPFANAAWVPTEGQAADPRLAGTVFADYPQRANFILAAAWWRASGLEPAALYEAARTFRLGRHRLAKVAQEGGATYWNDSKATNFHAVEAALARFPRPVLLIAGGKSKGGDVPGFVRRIAPRVRRAFLIGETREELARACEAAGVGFSRCGSLAEAVRGAAAEAGPGDNVLLSPAFSSFDMFLNYEDRGDQFERLVRERIAAEPAGLR